jgi:hypothetical protein
MGGNGKKWHIRMMVFSPGMSSKGYPSSTPQPFRFLNRRQLRQRRSCRAALSLSFAEL